MSQCPLHFCNFPTNHLLVVPFAQIFLSIKLFLSVPLKTLASSCSKMYCGPMKWWEWFFASTGINGVSLAHYISYTSMVTYLFFNVFFETDIVNFTLKVNPQGTRPTNMQLVLMYSTDWMLVRHFCDALVYKDVRNFLKMLFIYSRAQDKTEYHTMEFHTLMLYHWATENSPKGKLQFSLAQ